jgi:MinD superfamily P-loop ATPase
VIVAVASGKGGTGKTTVALALALAAGRELTLLDCDVEEPNCALFLAGEPVSTEPVGIPVPIVDGGACTACGVCGEACQFHGIVVLPTGALVFPSLCHGCGACVRLCPVGAIREGTRVLGELSSTRVDGITLVTGRLIVGEALAPPVVRAVRQRATGDGLVIIDAPPGTACTVMAALRGADVVVLVTEPTPFGLNDLTLAVEAVRLLGVPFGVVVNRADCGDRRVHDYCASESIPVLLEVADDRRIAEAYARGLPLVTAMPHMVPRFAALLGRLADLAATREGFRAATAGLGAGKQS